MNTEVKYIGTVPVKLFTGEKPAKSVLAVHGFGGSKDSLAIEGLAQRLCDKGFRVAAPDLPCHGERTEKERELQEHQAENDAERFFHYAFPSTLRTNSTVDTL